MGTDPVTVFFRMHWSAFGSFEVRQMTLFSRTPELVAFTVTTAENPWPTCNVPTFQHQRVRAGILGRHSADKRHTGRKKADDDHVVHVVNCSGCRP